MRSIGYISIALLAVCHMASADPTNAPQGPVSTGTNWVDKTHSNIGVKMDQAAVWLDDSLGDTGVMTGNVATCSATIGSEVLLEEGGSARFRARGRARFDLPRMKRRLHLFVDNFRYDVLPNADSVDNGDEVNVGTHWNLSKTIRSMFDFDIGVKIRRPPQVFTRLEFVFKHQLGDWAFRLDQKEF
jgi:hypothetical protein